MLNSALNKIRNVKSRAGSSVLPGKTLHSLLACSFFFGAFCFLILAPASAQITFQKTYGGTNDDGGYSVQQTTDGGYIIAGGTTSFSAGNGDVYLIKTDVNGDSLWTKTFGGIYGDGALAVKQTADGGYIISGITWSVDAVNNSIYIIKTDANGDSLWTKAFGGASLEYGWSVQQTTDGGYIIGGHTQSFGLGIASAYLIRTDANGDTLWSKTFGGSSGSGFGRSVQQTADGGYILAGWTSSFGSGGADIYLIKTDTNGDALWTKTYGGVKNEWGYFVQQTSDGGYILTGTRALTGGNYDAYLIKTHANGNLMWTKSFGGLTIDEGNSVQQTTDGGYILVTNYNELNTGDINLIKTDANGDSLWTKSYGGINNDEGNSVQQTLDGGYIITGTTYSFGAGNADVYLIKTDANGNSGCNQGNSVNIIHSPFPQGIIAATIVTSPSTISTSPAAIVGSGGIVTTPCTTVGIYEITTNNSFLISPNPSPGNFIISFTDMINKGKIEIFNAYGSKVFNQNIHHTLHTGINLKNISDGIYFVKMFDGETQSTKKLIIQKD